METFQCLTCSTTGSFTPVDTDGQVVFEFPQPEDGEMSIKLVVEGVTELQFQGVVVGGGPNPSKTVKYT